MVFRFAGNSLWSAPQHLGLGIVTPVAADFLRQRLRKFEEYFGVKTHDDTQAPSTY